MLMKKLFLLFAAIIAVVAVSAKEITVDLSKAQGYTHSETGSGAVELADGVLTVNWEVGTGWEVAGTEIPLDNLEGIIPLDNLEGVEKLDFDYVGDGGGTTMYVYLRDSEGNRWWNEDGYSLSVEEWVPVEFIPLSPLWDAPGYEVGEKPFVSIGFIANPASPTSGVFKLREVRITVADGEEPPVEEEGVIYQWSAEEAEQIGVTFIGAAGVEISSVKIHENTDEVPAIKFGNSYKYEDGKYIAIKPAEGGFKAGDELQIAICFSNSDDTKEAQAAVYAADTETQLFLSELAVNGRTFADDPAVEKFILESDQDSLLIGRKGGTSLFVISLKVVRGGEVPPVVVPKPETAPPAPEHAEADVMALFCNHYTENNLNFNVLGWGGVATWENLEIEGTNILYCQDMKWEILTNWDAASYDFSEYEKFHFDVWAPQAGHIMLTFEALGVGDGGSGWKKGIDFAINAGWNTIDCDPAWWVSEEAPYDWKDVKYVIFEGYKHADESSAENEPFAFANIYWWKTPSEVPIPEEGVIYKWAAEEADQVGVTFIGAAGVEISSVKIHENTDEVPAIKFSSSYVFDDGKYIAIKPAEGGFKAGDELQIAICFSNSDDSKEAQAAIYAADTETQLFLSEMAVNGRTFADDPAVEKFILESDQDSLLIGRKGGTSLFVISLKVVRGGEVPPVVVPKPETAPPAPEHAEADVMALFSNHYTENNLNFNVLGWGGVATWENLEIEGTNILYCQDMKWEILTNWDAASYDFSEYEKFHFDVWSPDTRWITVTFEALGVGDGGSGSKLGVRFKINAGWNTIDADPSWWIPENASYDWKDVKYVIFEGYMNEDESSAEGTPFAFANLYWWKKPAPSSIPDVAPNAPTIAEDHVQALFSATYQERTFNFAPVSWGSQWIEHTFDNGQKMFFAESFAWDGFTNWDADHYDLTNEPIYDMVHADIYVTVDASIKITFEALGAGDGGTGWKEGLIVGGLKANQWNSVDVDLLAAPYDTYEFTDLRYLILEGFTSEGTPLGIANVYFYSSMNQAVENVDASQKAVKRIVNGQLVIEKNGVLYNVLGAQF